MSTPSLPSIVRTLVPFAVGQAISLVVSLGIVVPDEVEEALTVLIGFIVGTVYYLLVRFLEQKFPWFGALLGWAAVPESYTSARVRNSQGTEVIVDEAVVDKDEPPHPLH